VRDLRSGGARRFEIGTGVLVAAVTPAMAGWNWCAFDLSGVHAALTRDSAKSAADEQLRGAGWHLVDVQGGCLIEKE
jgi:hypothetical protein